MDAFWKDKKNVKEAERVFKIYDTDKSGYLDRKEFSKFAHDFYKYMEAKGVAKYLAVEPSVAESYLNSRFDKLVSFLQKYNKMSVTDFPTVAKFNVLPWTNRLIRT